MFNDTLYYTNRDINVYKESKLKVFVNLCNKIIIKRIRNEDHDNLE